MKQSRILPLLGPTAVLYLVAAAASTSGGLSEVAIFAASMAFVASLAPLWLRGFTAAEQPGARRVGTLGLASGVALAANLVADTPTLADDIFSALSLAAVGGLGLDLALTVPRGPDAFRRLRPLIAPLAITAAALGVLAVAPPFELFGQMVIAPSASFVRMPPAFALSAGGLALLLRLLRRPLGSSPEALASNAWAVMGLVPALATLGGLYLLVRADGDLAWVPALGAFAVLSLLYGHSTLVNPKLRLRAGGALRRALTAAVTLGGVSALVATFHDRVPTEVFTLAVAVVGVLLLGALLERASAPVVRFLFAPAGGRLLDAIEGASSALGEATTLEEAGVAVLPPLRAASGDLEARPLLLTVAPAFEVGIDAASVAHSRALAIPETLARRLADEPGVVVIRSALEDKVVRRPALRPLVETLIALDAIAVLPLSIDGELEGALVVPRGRRRTTLSLEELARLTDLGRQLSVIVSILSARARAETRAGAMSMKHDRVEERAEDLEEERDRLRADARVMQRGRAAGPMGPVAVGYSPKMRAFETRLLEVAPMEAPILLIAEGGSSVDQLAQRIHRLSARSDGPFVLADCASIPAAELDGSLFGSCSDEEVRPGWIQLAAGGTLLLADVPALSLESQRQLAEALALRQARVVGGAASYPLDTRIVATSRSSLEALVELGTFDAELARWLTRLEVVVPPLRERREDIPSLVLLALDRACRVTGREAMGIEQAALDVLLAHDFPGNVRELQNTIERSVRAASGSQVRLTDLPTMTRGDASSPEPASDPFDGSFAEVEKRILEHALERSTGNKSEAARRLGLKRTTFLDKLRRHGLDASKGSKRSEDAA